MQNDKEKFKNNFIERLMQFSINIIQFLEETKVNRLLWSVNDQLIRSATSIGANVVEAKSSSSRRDYIHFFEIALKSANETKYWLLIIMKLLPQPKNKLEFLYNEAEEIAKIIGSSVLTLKGKR